MTSILGGLLKATENEFANLAEDGITAGDLSGWVDTGSYTLNALVSGSIYGGFPGNKIVIIGAEPATGKSFLALGAAKNFLLQNPTGIVMMFETEAAVSKQMLTERGIDTKRFGVVSVSTVQEFKTQILKVIDNYEKLKKSDRVPLFFILDSLGNLSTTKEMEDSLSGSDKADMTRAKQLKGAFRTITLRAGRAQVPLIVTNHVYADITGGLYAGSVQSGGSGALYSASLILTLTKAKEKDGLTNTVTGVIITVTTYKSRLTKENQKVKILIRYDGGLDRYYGLLELAEAAGAFKKVSTRYELDDGSKVFGKAIMRQPEKYFTQPVLEKIENYVNREFRYGSSGNSSGDIEDASDDVESEGSD